MFMKEAAFPVYLIDLFFFVDLYRKKPYSERPEILLKLKHNSAAQCLVAQSLRF